MNYKKLYFKLIISRFLLNRDKNDGHYYEAHHIIPKHRNGFDVFSNLVLLTPREHFIAHHLYAKWKGGSKAWLALARMRNDGRGNKVNSRQYGICRTASMRGLKGPGSPSYGRIPWNKGRKGKFKHTKEARRKISEAGKRRKGHKMSPEAIEKNRIKSLGRKASPETRRRMSEALKGRIVSLETREKLRQANTGKKQTKATVEKAIVSKWLNRKEVWMLAPEAFSIWKDNKSIANLSRALSINYSSARRFIEKFQTGWDPNQCKMYKSFLKRLSEEEKWQD